MRENSIEVIPVTDLDNSSKENSFRMLLKGSSAASTWD